MPEDMAPDELTVEKAEELLAAPGSDPRSEAPRDGPPDRREDRPVRAVRDRNARGGRDGEAARLVALQVDVARHRDAGGGDPPALAAPDARGDPADGEEVTAQNGRYGPYVKKGTEYRSLEWEEQLFTITLEEALALLAQPKERRGRGAPKPPLKELGPDPVSGKPIVVKEGRFGPYVTDGETNASLRRGDEPETRVDRARGRIARRAALQGPGTEEENAYAPIRGVK